MAYVRSNVSEAGTTALPKHEDLTLVLVVASVTPTSRDELQRMGWTLTPLGGGYGRIDEAVYTTFVVITDEVTETERDSKTSPIPVVT